MRVRGNLSPDVLSIETYRPKDGYVEIRLRENIKSVAEMDEMTGQEIQMFEYDEYTFGLPEREGLREEIETNMADWIITGRTLEVNAGASILADMQAESEHLKGQNDALVNDMAQLVEEVYQSDLEMMTE